MAEAKGLTKNRIGSDQSLSNIGIKFNRLAGVIRIYNMYGTRMSRLHKFEKNDLILVNKPNTLGASDSSKNIRENRFKQKNE